MFSTLPTDYRIFLTWTWADVAPYYQDLNARPLDAANVAAWLSDWTRIGKVISETYARLHLATTLNTADAEAERRYLAFLSEVQPKVEEAEQQLKQKLLDSGLQPIGFEMPLRNLRAEAELFREANLPLILQGRKLGQQYNKIVGAQSAQWQGQELTLQQLRPIGLSADRSIREQVWRLSSERWLTDRGAINALWRQAIPLRQQIAHTADHDDFRSYAWRDRQRFDYTPENCLEFHAAIEAVVVPAASRIYDRARQRLGVDVIRPWDLDLDRNPISLDAPPPFKDEAELMAKTAAVFAQVDPQLGEYYATMQRQGLLDLDNRKGKAPGAFCTEFLVTERPFIFMNAVGLRDDVRTMLHESGHAFHVFETLHLPYIQQLNITMEIAEVASMAMELLASPYLSDRHGGFYSGPDYAQDRAQHLERIILFWPYMAMVDAFQHWVYTHDAGSDPAACDAKWTELAQRFMPGVDWAGLDDALMTGWHRKQHIHRSPFYYVEYGLAQLGAVQVWRNALTDQAEALAAYRRALALGATRPLPELYAAANVKFAFDAETLREAVDLIESHIQQLEA
ncbi:MAG: M3 family oligoendopeptidase [Thermoflexales bacterium]|nr:M3 family oligoendopeptidase [Thermoflexales bacterium]